MGFPQKFFIPIKTLFFGTPDTSPSCLLLLEAPGGPDNTDGRQTRVLEFPKPHTPNSFALCSNTDDLIKAQRGSAMYPGSHSQIQSWHSNSGHMTLETIGFITKLFSQDSFRPLALGATSSGPALTAGSHRQGLTPNLIFARLVNMKSLCQAW